VDYEGWVSDEDVADLFSAALEFGHTELLAWAMRRVEGGLIAVPERLRDHAVFRRGSEDACVLAAQCGRLGMLRWLADARFRCDRRTFAAAARRGDLATLQWMGDREGVAMDAVALMEAAASALAEVSERIALQATPQEEEEDDDQKYRFAWSSRADFHDCVQAMHWIHEQIRQRERSGVAAVGAHWTRSRARACDSVRRSVRRVLSLARFDLFRLCNGRNLKECAVAHDALQTFDEHFFPWMRRRVVN
jgi:hypothetical protein